MTRQLRVVVVGAGMTGLTTAMILARAGHRVIVLDRDPAPPEPTAEQAWASWDRPGVRQFRHPHLMLPRWHHELRRELPEVLDALVAGGAARFNLLHLQPEEVTRGWWPGDERFDTITARRPVLEAALAQQAEAQSGLRIRRGLRATGLLVTRNHPVPRVVGVRTAIGTEPADLVIDAAGRHTPTPSWLTDHGVAAPPETREESGFVYYARNYTAHDGVLPRAVDRVLSHYPSLSVLTLPGDLGTYSVVLITSSRDRQMRELRHEQAWSAVAAQLPAAASWLDGGTPTGGVLVLAGLQDIRRSYIGDAGPLVTGLVAVGDAANATNPSLGRGAAIGVLHARAVRDALATAPADPSGQVLALDDAISSAAAPWVEATTRFDRHRLGELEADIAGETYATDDTSWAMTTALLAGAGSDPALARAAARIAAMVDLPSAVFSDPQIAAAAGRFVRPVRYPTSSPRRAELLAAISRGVAV